MEDKKIIEAELCGLKDLLEEKFIRFDDKLRAIKDNVKMIKDNNTVEHCQIIEQTTKTNGTVRSLQIWKAYITGAITVLTVLVLPIVFMILRDWLSS
jgi:hypothetical protein